MTGRARDEMTPFTKWLALLILPFLVVGSVLLYLLPTETELVFAWTIQPPLTAMLLGSAYLGGVWFFVHVVWQTRWHRVRHGFPAIVVFASLAGVATLLHVDRFHAGHVSFIAWLVLYLVTPFLVLGTLLANRQSDDGLAEEGDFRIPFRVRAGLGSLGVLALLVGLALFLVPQAFLSTWAWDLTPLTGRIVGAVLTLPGMVNLWLFFDERWSAFRWIHQAQLFSLSFIALALVFARGDLQWSRPAAPLFVTGIVLSLLGYAAFYWWCDRHSDLREEGGPGPRVRSEDVV